jgi:hypothetical protein
VGEGDARRLHLLKPTAAKHKGAGEGEGEGDGARGRAATGAALLQRAAELGRRLRSAPAAWHDMAAGKGGAAAAGAESGSGSDEDSADDSGTDSASDSDGGTTTGSDDGGGGGNSDNGDAVFHADGDAELAALAAADTVVRRTRRRRRRRTLRRRGRRLPSALVHHPSQLLPLLHELGVNGRLLPLLRAHLRPADDCLRHMLEAELLGRVAKRVLRTRLLCRPQDTRGDGGDGGDGGGAGDGHGDEDEGGRLLPGAAEALLLLNSALRPPPPPQEQPSEQAGARCEHAYEARVAASASAFWGAESRAWLLAGPFGSAGHFAFTAAEQVRGGSGSSGSSSRPSIHSLPRAPPPPPPASANGSSPRRCRRRRGTAPRACPCRSWRPRCSRTWDCC